MAENLPYSTSVSTLINMLEKIKSASVPERFTQDFVSSKLTMKGGTAAACIPFLKKMGFVASDGSPTELYKEFRNPHKSRIAVGKAFKKLYQKLYEMNEYVHDAPDQEILGMIVQCTGGEKDSTVTKSTLSTLNALRKISDFDTESNDEMENSVSGAGKNISSDSVLPIPSQIQVPLQHHAGKGINLAYTINLNLPATKDIEVFNAIFKSLKEHILGD
ncbi:DUF5343 domain-containing protein [Pseudomonas sp. TH49]|uniref:DUF5343 domain-containing protein n=1 Tax=Pseudomonas sp. TH49 TaxID=2796413 RepID=UPI0019144E05|nr:DUF5343 domain-containing protein [Pseudomonas sp. TH49]MBK5343198.1 DUF5343 domain-containing protein [Pseudomonas sp. TH49]